jgi:integrase
MSELSNAIQAARPNLSTSSVKTYVSILGSLHRKVFGGDVDIKDFDDSQKIIEFLKSKPPAARKTIYSALTVITQKKEYRDAMMLDIGKYNEVVASQVMSQKQKESAISPDEVKAVYDALAARAAEIYKKRSPTVGDLLQIQDFVLMALMSGVHTAPRRSLDWTAFKLRDFNTEKDNYMTSKFLVFNQFKTVKSAGRQEVPLPVELKKILTRWSKINPTSFLLFNSKLLPLTSPQVTQMFNRIFNGKKVSTNQLRHSFLTGKFAAYSKEQKVVADTMAAMGSSPAVLSSYVRF